jgi:S1-C subfamily serine protease
MEDLNKNQIVLLTLLISFVTSIATGIMTVSLLQEAPIEVTRNINRIVEKTIETVTTPGTPLTPQKEVTTVVVKEDDLIVSSIDKNIKSIVRIKEKNGLTGESSFYGVGLVVNKEGLIAADRKTIIEGNSFVGLMSDGTEFNLNPTSVDKQTNFILFKIATTTKYAFSPTIFSEIEPKLGQTVISLGGDLSNSISVGRVISLDIKDSTVGTTTTKNLVGINTDVASKDLIDGSPLFNLSGDIVGVKLSSDLSKLFVPISLLKRELSVLIEIPKTH